jgi:hypothetical protein
MAMPRDRSASKHSGTKPVRSGGGLQSLKTKQVREATREKPATHKVSEEAAGQLGASVGFRAPTLYQSHGFQPVRHGNELATNVGKGGPGAGRTVHRSGSQGTHGSVSQGVKDWAPDVPATGSKGPDIHSMYGPEKSRR